MNNSPLPAELCEREPALNDYGFYRRLDDGNFEFISFCNPQARHYFAILDSDLETILKETLPKPESAKWIDMLHKLARR